MRYAVEAFTGGTPACVIVIFDVLYEKIVTPEGVILTLAGTPLLFVGMTWTEPVWGKSPAPPLWKRREVCGGME